MVGAVTAIWKSRRLYITAAASRRHWARVISELPTLWIGVVLNDTGEILWSRSATAAEKMLVIAFLASLDDGG